MYSCVQEPLHFLLDKVLFHFLIFFPYRQLHRLEMKLSSDITMILSLLQQQHHKPLGSPGYPLDPRQHDETSDPTFIPTNMAYRQKFINGGDRVNLGTNCDKGLERSQQQGCASSPSLQVTMNSIHWNNAINALLTDKYAIPLQCVDPVGCITSSCLCNDVCRKINSSSDIRHYTTMSTRFCDIKKRNN